MLDRTIQPKIKSLAKLPDVKLVSGTTIGKRNIKYFSKATEPLIKIDFVFNAGTKFGDHAVAVATSELLIEGTKNYPLKKLINEIDFNGAYLLTEINFDTIVVSLITLQFNLHKTLPLLVDAAFYPMFPENQIELFKKRKKASIVESLKKNTTIARNKFMEITFGENHPYGKYLTIADIDKITKEDLSAFHQNQYTLDNLQIIVAGKIDESDKNYIETELSKISNTKHKLNNVESTPIITSNPKIYNISNSGSVQSTIRMGFKTIGKTHPDYIPLKITNTLLGGYFGSRLMTSIREKAGLTYGIYSIVNSLMDATYFSIVSDVNSENVDKTVELITQEIEKLKNEVVPDDELLRLKNYINGELLSMYDGAFSLSDTYQSLMNFNLSFDYFNQFKTTIDKIDSKLVNEMAKKYLNISNLVTIIVGP